jgi:hypothetical protein
VRLSSVRLVQLARLFASAGRLQHLPSQGCVEEPHRSEKKLIDRIEKKMVLPLHFSQQSDWDFYLIVFGEIHSDGHHCWYLHDTYTPRAPAAELLLVTGHQDINFRIYDATVTWHILLNAIFIPMFGMEGAGVGTALASIRSVYG